ncbi:MAG: hypothetical protein HQL08_03645 [Nitrospirae bacterium]|nr:hypothetical protein [Nitrospirota bacterium]
MRESLVLGNLTQDEIEELNIATEAMRRNRLQRPATIGDVDSYLQFLDDRQELFGHSAKIVSRPPLVINESAILS